jgi:hypothetical protein
MFTRTEAATGAAMGRSLSQLRLRVADLPGIE